MKESLQHGYRVRHAGRVAVLGKETVCQALKNTKASKQSGLDYIKEDVLIRFAESGVCLKTLTRALNEVVQTG